KDNKEVMVLFTKSPLIHYLSENTKVDFIENVDRTTRYSKLYSLMVNSIYFYEEIMYNYNTIKNNYILRFLGSFKYTMLEIIMFILSFIINIILLSTYKKDQQHG